MNKKKYIKIPYLLSVLILFSFFVRLISTQFLSDTYIENEWQVLLENLINYKTYSFYKFGDQLVPSAYMPPMYVFFLYIIKIVTSFEQAKLLNTIIFIQIIMSVYCVYIFYQINKNFFTEGLSIINSFVFSLIPLNIYYCGQISSINLQIILSLLFLKILLLLIKEINLKNIILFSVTSSFLILTRGEFILIFLLCLCYIIFFKKIKITDSIKIVIIVLLIISPYVIRNYIQFNQFFIVKSLGYNLWKGNNQLSVAEGYENLNDDKFKKLHDKIKNVEKNKTYEVNRDQIFLNEALNNLSEEKLKYTKLFFKKIISFYFIDFNSSYPNYYNIFHFIPILLVSLLSFPGLLVFFNDKEMKSKLLGLYLFSNIFIFSIFFILPRYKLIILPIQIILAASFITYIMKKYGTK
tara:strand:- start:1598 stop:2824 length:1227 start_codon:yes stop_codon:yes gene_type:complete